MAYTRKRGLSWRTVAWAVALLIIGVIMLSVGLSEWYSHHDRAVAMVVVGSLAFLPGVFACYIMVGAALRWRGFSYSQIPAYDD